MQSFDDELLASFGYDNDNDKKQPVYPAIKLPAWRGPAINTSSASTTPAFRSLRAPIPSSTPVQGFRIAQQVPPSSYYASPARNYSHQQPVIVKDHHGRDQVYVPPHMHQQQQQQYASRAPEYPLHASSSSSPSQRRSNKQRQSPRKRKYDQYSDEEDDRYFSDSADEKDKSYGSRQRETRKYRNPRREKRSDYRDEGHRDTREVEKSQVQAKGNDRQKELEEQNAQLNGRLQRMENMMNAAQASNNNNNNPNIQYSSPQVFYPQRQQQQQQNTPTQNSFINFNPNQNTTNHQFSTPTQNQTCQQSGSQVQPQTTNTPLVDHSHRVSAYTSKNGIRLINVSVIPDLYRTIFSFKMFNAVQSLAFPTLYDTDENMVISAPTGAGKTVLFELGMLRIFRFDTEGQIVYLAPTKSLCKERVDDWRRKFSTSRIKCAELTGDTSMHAIQEAKTARIIVTTPEKWDSVTRRTKEHLRWYDKVRLFCIDEVHLLAEERGSVLEVIVSRMKNLGTPLRFLAVSATVPNIEDVASWLGAGGSGNNDMLQEDKGMARVFKFDDEFRPCQLQKVVNGYPNRGNDSAFDMSLNYQLLDVITKHSSGKPVLVFCPTRKGVEQAAKQLLSDYKKALIGRQAPPWPKPTASRVRAQFQDSLTGELAEAGIGMHHAGFNRGEREITEQEYINGKLRILCTTSTLAVGVNLPARMVIVKGTKMWNGQEGLTDYSDLDILQMMGRAGRPQFDDRGVAVIMCTQEDKPKYEALMRSQTMLESCLHKTLVEHINSEIAIKTICRVEDALKWMRNSFLYVRIKKNPEHYRSLTANRTDEEGNAINLATDPETRLEEMVAETVNQLVEDEFVEKYDGEVTSTQYGDMLCQYSIRLKTFAVLKEIPPNPSMNQILEAISQAAEFGDIRFRAGEKKAYSDINKRPDDMGIKYPVTAVEEPSDKVNLLLQLSLAGHNLRELKPAGQSPGYEAWAAMNHAGRVTQCLIDLAREKQDVKMLKYSLELRRCIAAKTWENIPNVMSQVPNIGIKNCLALAAAGIHNLRDLRNASAEIVGPALTRSYPLASGIINSANNLPWFTIQLNNLSERVKPDGVNVSFEVIVGLDNLQVTLNNSKKNNNKITVSIQTMTSDYEWIDYERIKLKKIADNDDGIYKYRRSAILTKPSQKIVAFVSCEETAGNGAEATLIPKTPAGAYPIPDTRPRSSSAAAEGDQAAQDDEDMPMPDQDPVETTSSSKAKATKAPKQPASRQKVAVSAADPEKLENGKYKCSHTTCKPNCNHVCCRDGVARPPKKKPGTAAKTAGKIAATQTQATAAKKATGTTATKSKASASATKTNTNKASSSMPSLTHASDSADEVDQELPAVSKSKNLNRFLATNPKINGKSKASEPTQVSQIQGAKKTPLARNATPSSSSLPNIDDKAPTKKTGVSLSKSINKTFSSDSLPDQTSPPTSHEEDMQFDAKDTDNTPQASKGKKPLFRPPSHDSEDEELPSIAAISTPKAAKGAKVKKVPRVQQLAHKRKKNPYIDDEAQLSGDGEDTAGEMTDDNPGSLVDFIDDNTEIEEGDDSEVDELQESESKSKLSRTAFSPEV